ncbi:MAG TPA: hypothetical protein VND23_06545 [Acidimicrobiales bacterium]|nr:hypothetical protein [Acidimicrobiales bacterium]
MARRDALREHLKVSDVGPIEMTFTEIERLVGPVPPSAPPRPLGPAAARRSAASAMTTTLRAPGGVRT